MSDEAGGTQGAIDNDYDDALRDARAELEASVSGIQGEPVAGGLAIDIVTRQMLFVRRQTYESLVEHYEAEAFNLLAYGPHPYLPVTIDDAVFECYYLSDVGLDTLEDWASTKSYDFPAGRLAPVAIWEAWDDE